MKEAAGEANMTVITIVLIAIVLAVGTAIVTGLMNNTKKTSCCQSLGGKMEGNMCHYNGTSATMTKEFMKTNCEEE